MLERVWRWRFHGDPPDRAGSTVTDVGSLASTRDLGSRPVPGLLPREPGLERYRVAGGAAIALELRRDDSMTVIDLEGRQACELLAFSSRGMPDPGALDLAADDPPDGILAILTGGAQGAAELARDLNARGLAVSRGRAARLFGSNGEPGGTRDFRAHRSCTCVIAAPGAAMTLTGRSPLTDLRVLVRRARPGETPEARLPAPLATARLDLPVARATATGYEVKAGEYIQIIDVRGRQCSDFMSLDRRALDKGEELELDATATRTLMGSAYPRPGLYSRFYDEQMLPVVEVVRDTVGRHDTFALACTARGYEQKGYFGHINCSDNISEVLAPYGVAPRPAWRAINFFFNSRIDWNNLLYSDEAWSRPGDYVLMQAKRDLVCASTACPDDIDPINGWNPTEIHVRVYKPEKLFSRSVAYRMTPDSDPVLTQESAFHPRTSGLTRNYAVARDTWLPSDYRDSGAIAEYWAVREAVGVMDLSNLRKFDVLGPDAEELLQQTMTRDIRRLAVGQVIYSALCYEHGGMVDDGTLFRLGPDNFRWVGGNDHGGLWLRQQAEALGLKAWVKTATGQLQNLAVQGPKSRDLLKGIIWTPETQPRLEEIRWFRFTIGRIGDNQGVPVMVSRTGYSGELGYELFCHHDHALAVWDAVMTAGEALGVTPFGLQALEMLRIEAGLAMGGQEFDDQTDPFDAGIGFAVPLARKTEAFVGRAALERNAARPRHRLVGLILEGQEPALPGDGVYLARARVGQVTSACRSPLMKAPIAMARLAVEYADEGRLLELGKLDGFQKRIPVKVVPLPFYDPKKERPRM